MSNELHELDDIDVPDIRNRIGTPTRFEGVEIETVHAGARVRAAAIALARGIISHLEQPEGFRLQDALGDRSRRWSVLSDSLEIERAGMDFQLISDR